MSVSGRPGDIKVQASHARPGRRAGRRTALGLERLQKAPPGGRGRTSTPRSPARRLARVFRSLEGLALQALAPETATRGLQLPESHRTGPPTARAWRITFPGGRQGVGFHLCRFPTTERTWCTSQPEVPGSRARGWPELPGWSRAFLWLRWRPSIPNPPKGNYSCRRHRLQGTMVPGLPRSFRPSWQRSELRSRVRSVGRPEGGYVGLRGSGLAGYPGDPGTRGGGGQLGACGGPAYPADPVLCPAGSREELVERLQSYTRQVSVRGGTSG